MDADQAPGNFFAVACEGGFPFGQGRFAAFANRRAKNGCNFVKARVDRFGREVLSTEFLQSRNITLPAFRDAEHCIHEKAVAWQQEIAVGIAECSARKSQVREAVGPNLW